MNYDDFMKSKRIAERWGEAQTAFESTDHTGDLVYYHELLTDFYDYIQELEGRFLVDDGKVATVPSVQVPEKPTLVFPDPVPSPLADVAVGGGMLGAQELLTDEDDPWFGFD